MKESRGFWKTVNSPLCLLLLGFVCTTFVGTILTDRFQRVQSERELRFGVLHTQRAMAIREIHDRLIVIESRLRNLSQTHNCMHEDTVAVEETGREFSLLAAGIRETEFPDSIDSYVEQVLAFSLEAEKCKVFFAPELTAVIDSLCDAHKAAAVSFRIALVEHAEREKEIEQKQKAEAMQRAREMMLRHFPPHVRDKFTGVPTEEVLVRDVYKVYSDTQGTVEKLRKNFREILGTL